MARVSLWAVTLVRVLVLAALAGTGIWHVAAARIDVFVDEVAEDFLAGPEVTTEWPVFGVSLRGIARLRVAAGQVIKRARPVTAPHRRLVNRLDDSLLAWLRRL